MDFHTSSQVIYAVLISYIKSGRGYFLVLRKMFKNSIFPAEIVEDDGGSYHNDVKVQEYFFPQLKMVSDLTIKRNFWDCVTFSSYYDLIGNGEFNIEAKQGFCLPGFSPKDIIFSDLTSGNLEMTIGFLTSPFCFPVLRGVEVIDKLGNLIGKVWKKRCSCCCESVYFIQDHLIAKEYSIKYQWNLCQGADYMIRTKGSKTLVAQLYCPFGPKFHLKMNPAILSSTKALLIAFCIFLDAGTGSFRLSNGCMNLY